MLKINPRLSHQLRGRNNRGNTLILVLAFILLLIPISLFFLQYTRITGANQEQKTAIEGAALSASRDLARIIVEDPYFGYVSMCDYAPSHAGTKTGDNFYTPVRSINTVLATVRLDMIVADKIDSTIMRNCSQRDYAMAVSCKDRLVAALNAAILPGATAEDVDGNIISPYDDAVKAYQSNVIRLTGGPTSLKANSLKLTLGWEPNMPTNTKSPQPSSISFLNASETDGTFYKANVNAPYKGYNFVLASTSNDVTLVDFKPFLTAPGNLPYVIPGVVKCEADENYTYHNPNDAAPISKTVHSVACAQLASTGEHLPAPGALVIDNPGGTFPGFATLTAAFSAPPLLQGPTDMLYTAPNEDSPPGALAQLNVPVVQYQGLVNPLHPPFGNMMALGLYDWIRGAGTGVNVASLMDSFNIQIDTSTAPHLDCFQFDASGNVYHFTRPAAAKVTMPVSQNQIYARSGAAFTVGSPVQTVYDAYIKDYTYQPGPLRGGQHAGQPVSDAVPPFLTPPSGEGRQIDELSGAGTFAPGPIGGAARPSYTDKNSMAVVLLFRPRSAQ